MRAGEGTLGVCIQGGTGFGAGELLRLLSYHPNLRTLSVVSESTAGQAIVSTHTHLAGLYSQNFAAEFDPLQFEGCQERVLFLAVPSEASVRILSAILAKHSLEDWIVIDLSGAMRLKDPALHGEFYSDVPFSADLRARFQYAFPELDRDAIKESRFLANPGCLASASILSLLPLREELSEVTIAIDAKTGSSGAGKELKLSTQHATRHSNFLAYKPLVHQHQPEISQALGLKSDFSFVPQSLPLVRGIFVTTHLHFPEEVALSRIREQFLSYYQAMPFIRFRSESPQIADVVGTNFCDLAIHVHGQNVVILAAIDNLVKGMAGTAIQNMNIRCGFSETAGLMHAAPRPF